MSADHPVLTVSATKPAARVAKMLVAQGVGVLPWPEDEGNVERYILSKRLAIERRTGSGLLKGIMEKTLFTSAIYLREHFAVPVLIVEGPVNYEHTMFDPQAVRGALSSMLLQYGLSVLSTADIEETVALIAMMARQEQIGIPEISLIPKRKAADLPDMQRRVVEMLPGCGMVVARDLLQRFGSVKRAMDATEAELRQVRGVGAKTAAEIRKVLTAEYKAVDTEKNLEDAIEASPKLLFRQPVTLLARQHHIYTEQQERHIVDMVYVDKTAKEVILAELKRGKIAREHAAQLRRYLDNARKSKLLRTLLAEGMKLRGVLATVDECEFDAKRPDISVQIVDKKKTIAVLKRLRRRAVVRGA